MDFKEYIINQLKKAVEKDLLQIVYDRPFTTSGGWSGYDSGIKIDFISSSRLNYFLRSKIRLIDGCYRNIKYSFSVIKLQHSDRKTFVKVMTWPKNGKKFCDSKRHPVMKSLPIKEQIIEIFGG